MTTLIPSREPEHFVDSDARDEVSGAAASASRAGGALLMLFGVVIVRLLWQGTFTAYVRPGMAVPLGAAAATLLIMGAFGLLRRTKSRSRGGFPQRDVSDHDQVVAHRAAGHDGHGHGTFAKVSWLLVLPLLVLTVIAPGPLGADNAANTSAPTSVLFQPATLQPDASGIVTMKLRDLTGWTQQNPKRLLHRRVRVLGVVSSVSDGGRRVRLSRFTITCCAADATPFSADVMLGEGTATPPKGSWLEVVGTWNGWRSADGWPRLDGAAARTVGQPTETYEL
jgi:uncharacterized repeat protein (TIGR03943 family)